MRGCRPTRITLLLPLVLLAACSLGTGGAQPDIDRYYTIYADNYQTAFDWVLDGNGETVAHDERFFTLYDQLTGEPQCKTRRRQEAADAYDEYGNRIFRHYSALYDLDGNLLCDWDKCNYQAGFGDFVIRQSANLLVYGEWLPDDFVSELWNFRTGETLLADVGHIAPLDEGRRAALSDVHYRPLGVVEATGEIISGFPASGDLAYLSETWNDCIIGTARPFLAQDDEKTPYTLLSTNFETLLVREFLRTGLSQSYLYCYEEDANGVGQPSLINREGKVVFAAAHGQSIIYFDDQLAVLQSGEHDSQTDPVRRNLVDIRSGEVLAGDCAILSWPDTEHTKQVPDHFVAYRNGILQRIDRTGKVQAEREMPRVRYVNVFHGELYCCTIYDEGKAEGNRYTRSLLDDQLDTVIPEDLFVNISQSYTWEGDRAVHYPILLAQRDTAHEWQTLTDVLDLQGNVLVENLNTVYSVGPDRLAVRRGFEVGLMDWAGNWIVSRSIFAELVDD